MEKTIEIPIEFKGLFDNNWREAAIYGGRFSLKSHTIARYLIIRARQKKTRIGCFREFQNSITESSHQLLADLIKQYDLRDFEVTNNSIINRLNGSDFLFKGLYLNEQSIKSIEGIDIGWVEEAQTITKNSLEVLTPTIRKEGSQIIYSYNRLLEDDPVHQRLVLEGRPNTLVINVNYDIAIKYGWMPEVIRLEMEDDKAKRPSLYKHKWLGEPNSMERKIYRDWAIIDSIPHEAKLERYGLDYGYSNDPTAIVAVYRYNGGFIWDEITYQKGLSNRQIADILLNLPPALIVPDSAEPKSNDELISYGLNILPAQKGRGSVSQGIQLVQAQRMSVTRRSQNIIKEYNNYLWRVDNNDRTINEPEGGFDHCFVGSSLVLTDKGNIPIKDIEVGDLVLTSSGYKRVLLKHNNGIKQVSRYLLQLDTHNAIIECTEEHKIKTLNSWTQISQLESGMTVYTTKYSTIRDITYTKARDTFQALVKDYTSKYIKISMVMSRKVFTYITKMVTGLITILATLNLLRPKNTYHNTLRKELKIIHHFSLSFRQWDKIRQRFGTHLQRVWHGIKNMVKIVGKIVNIKHTNVYNAGSILNQDILESSSIAIITAKLKHLEKGESWKEEVYDLTVEDVHEYIVNGVLVHNCMDAGRYGMETLNIESGISPLEEYMLQQARNNSSNNFSR